MREGRISLPLEQVHRNAFKRLFKIAADWSRMENKFKNDPDLKKRS
jgi:hypothetical protein